MTQAKPTILIVDDDVRLRNLLDEYLSQQGFLIQLAENVNKAKTVLRKQSPDAIVLDIMMPGEDGLSFLKWLRAQNHSFSTTPVLMLTAMGEADDRIQGLESGAHDYLVKPFEPRELVLRLHNLVRRELSRNQYAGVHFGDFYYDFRNKVLKHRGSVVHLTSGEGKLLDMLLLQHGHPLSRTSLAEALGLTLSPRSVDVQMTRLRKKIEPDPKKPIFLCTLRHEGYVMRNVVTDSNS